MNLSIINPDEDPVNGDAAVVDQGLGNEDNPDQMVDGFSHENNPDGFAHEEPNPDGDFANGENADAIDGFANEDNPPEDEIVSPIQPAAEHQ